MPGTYAAQLLEEGVIHMMDNERTEKELQRVVYTSINDRVSASSLHWMAVWRSSSLWESRQDVGEPATTRIGDVDGRQAERQGSSGEWSFKRHRGSHCAGARRRGRRGGGRCPPQGAPRWAR